MNLTSSILTNKRIGMFMFISALIIVFSMLLHPQRSSEDVAAKWVHGSLISLLIFNAFGLGCLVDFFKGKGRQTGLAMLVYYIGLGSFIGAALVSGFVQTSLGKQFHADADVFINLSTYSWILNQALASLGVFCFGAAGILLSPILIMDKGISCLVGIVGCFFGTILVVAILAGLSLSVLNMTLLTLPIVLWHVTIGVWLVKH